MNNQAIIETATRLNDSGFTMDLMVLSAQQEADYEFLIDACESEDTSDTDRLIKQHCPSMEFIKKEKVIEYPYFGEASDGSVVVFYAKSCGVLIVKGHQNNHEVGTNLTDWYEHRFCPVKGAFMVILTNLLKQTK